jgi:hypothetical protein
MGKNKNQYGFILMYEYILSILNVNVTIQNFFLTVAVLFSEKYHEMNEKAKPILN